MAKDAFPKLGLAQRKTLSAVSLLEEKGFFGSSEGLSKIFVGLADMENRPFKDLACYGYWPSLSKKKVKGRLTQLVRKGCLRNVWVASENDYFLRLTEAGRALAATVRLRKKPLPQASARTIIHLEKEKKE
ncbi:MAG: hypothetical protein LKG11_06930 [Bacilli bacterium]|jgi:hypothetical protein|nr:hypothetical protein [Bacilli bacterium]